MQNFSGPFGRGRVTSPVSPLNSPFDPGMTVNGKDRRSHADFPATQQQQQHFPTAPAAFPHQIGSQQSNPWEFQPGHSTSAQPMPSIYQQGQGQPVLMQKQYMHDSQRRASPTSPVSPLCLNNGSQHGAVIDQLQQRETFHPPQTSVGARHGPESAVPVSGVSNSNAWETPTPVPPTQQWFTPTFNQYPHQAIQHNFVNSSLAPLQPAALLNFVQQANPNLAALAHNQMNQHLSALNPATVAAAALAAASVSDMNSLQAQEFCNPAPNMQDSYSQASTFLTSTDGSQAAPQGGSQQVSQQLVKQNFSASGNKHVVEPTPLVQATRQGPSTAAKPPKPEHASSEVEDSDPVAQAAVSALEAAVAAEAAKTSGVETPSLTRANSLRSLRQNSGSNARRGRNGKLTRSESAGEFAAKPQAREAVTSAFNVPADAKAPVVQDLAVNPNSDKAVEDAASALEEAVARETARKAAKKKGPASVKSAPVQSFVADAEDLMSSDHTGPGYLSEAFQSVQGPHTYSYLPSIPANLTPALGHGTSTHYSTQPKHVDAKPAADISNLPNGIFEFDESSELESLESSYGSYTTSHLNDGSSCANSDQNSEYLLPGFGDDDDDFSKLVGDLSAQSLGFA